MKPISYWLLAAARPVGQAFFSVLLSCLALSVHSATRPHYGGTLRVEMRVRVASVDPREWPSQPGEAAAAERVVSLVFDRLVGLNDSGRPQPELALAWQHDAESKRWEFRLRPSVKFHDGTPLTPARAAEALRSLMGRDRRVGVVGDWLVIESERPMPDLPAELARGRYFIFHLTSDGIAGTGRFRVIEWQPRQRLVLAANEDCWAGRPFVDSIALDMGVAAPRLLLDLELGKADVVDLLPEQVRRASQSGGRASSSLPVELLALVFDARRPAVQDVRLRQAVALSIDRASLVNALLQKQGEPAGSLLPQWLSGYAFLFSVEAQADHARQLREALSAAAPVVLVYDSADPEARAVAERVAVNARAVGIAVQVVGNTAAANADARLVRLRLGPTDARAALAALLAELGADALPPGAASPEQLYAAERGLLETYRVVPLVHLPEMYGLGPRVKDWMPPRWGGWKLGDVWLDTAPRTAAGGDRP